MNNKTGIAALFFFGVIGFWVFSYKQPTETPKNSAPGIAAQEERWKGRIIATDGKAAYEEFAKTVNNDSPELQHAGAHAFGAALYEALGAEGLVVCDSNFNFGCYHEFLGRAIAALGLSSVLTLNQGCMDALGEGVLSCQHGIGHGVMAYLGYTRKALLQGLSECEQLPYNDPIGGCYGGLFMEYNLETMLGKQARLRVLGANPQEPCDSLDPVYRAACYYWQPQWWNHSLKPKLEGAAAFKKMGEWCMDAENNIRACFEGIGNITPPQSVFAPHEAKKLCEAVSGNTLYQLYCKSVAANSLTLGGAGKKGNGIAVCEGLTGAEWTYCAAYAENKVNLLNRAEILAQ